jgi:hypothetical protein
MQDAAGAYQPPEDPERPVGASVTPSAAAGAPRLAPRAPAPQPSSAARVQPRSTVAPAQGAAPGQGAVPRQAVLRTTCIRCGVGLLAPAGAPSVQCSRCSQVRRCACHCAACVAISRTERPAQVMVPQGPGVQEVFRQCGRCATVLKQPEGEVALVAQRFARCAEARHCGNDAGADVAACGRCNALVHFMPQPAPPGPAAAAFPSPPPRETSAAAAQQVRTVARFALAVLCLQLRALTLNARCVRRLCAAPGCRAAPGRRDVHALPQPAGAAARREPCDVRRLRRRRARLSWHARFGTA